MINLTDKKNQMIALLLGLILLVSFKKKPLEGVYVPEDGDFGEFGTEGNFEQNTDGIKMPNFVGSLTGNNGVPIVGAPVIIDNSSSCGC